MATWTRVSDVPRLAPREAAANKGDFGKVLVVAGSRGMTGAAILCGSAALRSGAGLVRVAVPASVQALVAQGNVCYTTIGLADDGQGALSEQLDVDWGPRFADNDVIAMGPGLGRGHGTVAFLLKLLAEWPGPLVIDADGLNALVGRLERLQESSSVRVLTPHPGEFARLIGKTTKEVQAQRLELATEFANEHRAALVLKGHRTIVTDGKDVYENTTGNPGMATGGTGDVLAGIIAALLGQGLAPFAAAQLGVYVHGLAGDLARDALGEVAMIASDLLDYLPPAFRSLALPAPEAK